VRSDVERKRMHGRDPMAPAPAALGRDLYDAASTDRTYARLQDIARTAIAAGVTVIIDAAFLETARREAFVALALESGARPLVLSCVAPAEILRQRVAARRGDPSDAGLDVLEAQLARPLEIGALEAAYRVSVDTREDAVAAALSALDHGHDPIVGAPP
jgi:uncharacterized protein